MNAAVLGGLVEQWVWRCELVATEYQLRPSTNLKFEIDELVSQAETQARLLQATGVRFLADVEGRLALAAYIAQLSARAMAEEHAGPALIRADRVEALRALSSAFGVAADRAGSLAS
jgi:hypothetical protein